jgi:hypothetical protein
MPPKTTVKQFHNLLRKLVLIEQEKWEAKRRSKEYQIDWDNAFDEYLKYRVMQEALYADNLTEEEIEHNLRNDRNTHDDFILSSEAKELACKHGMEFAYHYNNHIWPEDSENKELLISDLIPVFKNSAPVTILPADPVIILIEGYKRYLHSIDGSKLREGRFLSIEIDLQHPVANIMAFLNYFIIHYSELLGESKRRRATKVDPMVVWDMTKRGMNRYEITKELFPDSVGTVDLNVYYKRIDRALKKAEKEIGEAHKQATE